MSELPKIVVMGPIKDACDAALRELEAAGISAQAAESPETDAADLIISVGMPANEFNGAFVVVWGAPKHGLPWLPEKASPEALNACLDAILRVREAEQESVMARHYDESLRELVRMLSPMGARPGLLHEVARVFQGALGSDRASIYMCGEDDDTLLVVGASDNAALGRLSLSLRNYPEVRAALESRATLYLEDTASSPLLGDQRASVLARGVGAILVAPIVNKGRALGAAIARWNRKQPIRGERVVSFCSLASSVLGTLLDIDLDDFAGERTSPVRMPSQLELDRQHTIQGFERYFESTSDGTLVVDREGAVLYMSHAAELLTGYGRDGVVGKPVVDLVAVDHRQEFERAIEHAIAGSSPLAFDVELETVSKDRIIVSVSTSAALAGHDAAIFVFRDVTEARSLEAELRKTKDFLERLIDSAVDGIVVSDIAANVLLFNKGAERIYGFAAEDVVGRLSADSLFPAGVARQVLEELRSSEHGGPGRLELGRREILTREGELVPVNMTAAMVFEEGREVAIIGIFSDLREWLKLEQSLHQVQEKLMHTEKQALIAELAGTTAHELNQPLTSIMGYAELIRRQLGPEEVHRRGIDTIIREAERMAEIVRKIGKITRYETKAYVGSTQILDLEKSTG